jgi:Putative DNA-binding domain
VIALAAQQQALLDALFAWPSQAAAQRLTVHARGLGSQSARGLQVYQSNGHALAVRALHSAYPVLAQMLGEDSFAHLARAFWHARPPHCGDMAAWGQDLAEFVRASEQLQGEPYLGDVVQAEWALHRCTFASDREADLGSLVLLTTDDPQTLTLNFAPGLAAVASTWPLASLLLAHLESSPSLVEVRGQLEHRVAQDVVIWRSDYQPRLRLALTGELPVLRALQAGRALDVALQACPDLDVSLWLPLAVQTGLVLGVSRCVSPPIGSCT